MLHLCGERESVSADISEEEEDNSEEAEGQERKTQIWGDWGRREELLKNRYNVLFQLHQVILHQQMYCNNRGLLKLLI